MSSEAKQASGQVQNSLRDLDWVDPPGRSVKVRIGRKQVTGWKSDVPLILRDLAPSTGFNPAEVWEREKEALTAAATLAPVAEEKEPAKKKKKDKPVNVSKADLIKNANKQRSREHDFDKEHQRLQNIEQREGMDGLVSLKDLRTDRGKLLRLLMILKLAVDKSNKTLAYDVLWAVEDDQLFIKGSMEKQQAAEAKTEPAAKGKKSKDKAEKPKKAAPESWEAETVHNYRKSLRQVLKWREGEDMIVKQLTDMSDRLPPLSKFNKGFKLDKWQVDVLSWIDNNQSVVVCAPTSSGKTIISTYVASLGKRKAAAGEEKKTLERKEAWATAEVPGAIEEFFDDDEALADGALRDEGIDEVEHLDDSDVAELLAGDGVGERVLFVVPTEPLVWQVAAHFSRHMLQGNVALITNQMRYAPNLNRTTPPMVVVGTPLALESALVKVRGYTTFWEAYKKSIDRTQLAGGFHHFKWVVYDEIHSLNDHDEGAALQRLIRMLKSKFLALSATVGNAEELRSWLEHVKGEQLQVQVVNARDDVAGATVDDSEARRLVKKKVHESRFMNLQRHVWMGAPVVQNEDVESIPSGLTVLHPLAAVTIDFLQNPAAGFATVSLPFTPHDSYQLWLQLETLFPVELVQDLDPHVYFANIPRITLAKTKEYEDALKSKVEALAKTHATEVQSLLDYFRLPEPPSSFNITDLVLDLKKKSMLPGLCFHLNAFKALQLFKDLLEGLESRQAAKFPEYHTKKIQQHESQQTALNQQLSAKKTEKEKEEMMKMSGETVGVTYVVDTTEPHPDFCVFNNTITLSEYNDVCKEVAKYDFRIKNQGRGNEAIAASLNGHALLRGLRRGVALYIDEVTLPAYRRAVMKMAMQGKLGVVFSDSSLAYGVNMPFRTCVFCTEMDNLLDSLMAQQMSGRAGRRGLDEQGHLVYAGATADFIREIMVGKIPAIYGEDPRFHFMCVPEITSKISAVEEDHEPYVNHPSFPHQTAVLGKQTLAEFIKQQNTGQGDNVDFMQVSREFCSRVGFIEQETESSYVISAGVVPPQLHMMWELRQFQPEAYILGKVLPEIYNDFVRTRPAEWGGSETAHVEFFWVLLHIVDRVEYQRPAEGDTTSLPPLHLMPYSVERAARWERWEQLIAQTQAQLEGTPYADKLSLKVPVGAPLDASLFNVIQFQHKVHELDQVVKYNIKQRIWRVGTILKNLHNCLYPDRRPQGYATLTHIITRKCFSRLMYLTRELLEREMDFPDQSSLEAEVASIRQRRTEISDKKRPKVETAQAGAL